MPIIQFNLKECCLNCVDHNIEVTTTTVVETNNLQQQRISKIQCALRDKCNLFNKDIVGSFESNAKTSNEEVFEDISEEDAYL